MNEKIETIMYLFTKILNFVTEAGRDKIWHNIYIFTKNKKRQLF